uniref:Beta-amylase n=1 Tax=Tetraselmis sp. GSL018 TaxID=582737 RepID=A0A061R8X8_9CHLO|eukprot:CAMPEP_0177597488 /NCGR_PEP_ID=MMETSP0419_2-20121207/11736_1 /TAXON_ID=582737 /ORGANISM="Tetraselmis sp., Strain GSL018" /LENGTH=769 /DNA_ID=CAMNT_0019089657 /DNA_START=639 /DNA_END=2948 /DNA_ORIENTATION=+
MTLLRGPGMSSSSYQPRDTVAPAANRRNTNGNLGLTVATPGSVGLGHPASRPVPVSRSHKRTSTVPIDNCPTSTQTSSVDGPADHKHRTSSRNEKEDSDDLATDKEKFSKAVDGQGNADSALETEDQIGCCTDLLENPRSARPVVASQSIRSLKSVNYLSDLSNGLRLDSGLPASVAKERLSSGSGRMASKQQQLRQTVDEGVPVFIMLPLDTVTSDGIYRYKTSAWFHHALQSMRDSGVRGVAVDIWWGAVERKPGIYDWSSYKQLIAHVKSLGLKMQVVLSFHACGGNVGDSAMIPLPEWVLEAGEHDPDLYFTDRPRGNRRGQRNRECISFFSDEVPGALAGRSPIECYQEFMHDFAQAFRAELGSVIEEVVVGAGPCGELRYPSYVEANGWRFPGVGEFQCYDRRALAQLAEAAADAGHPEWGHAGPHNAGWYNSAPEETGFFSTVEGSWSSAYGKFFMEWYSGALVAHGERLLQAANEAFGPKTPRPFSGADAAVSSKGEDEGANPCGHDNPTGQPGIQPSLNPRTKASARADGTVQVTLKIAGIHWYYRTRSHAAELTAGYYNTAFQNGYAPLIALCAKYGASLTLTCVEMCDEQHPTEASCSPEGLLYQVRRTAYQMGVPLSGENALPCFSPGGVDTSALERIIRNTSSFDPDRHPRPLSWGNFAPASVSMEQLRGSIASSSWSSSSSSSCCGGGEGAALEDGAQPREFAPLPSMRSFTFLRLNQEMIAPAYQGVWMRFIQRMQSKPLQRQRSQPHGIPAVE